MMSRYEQFSGAISSIYRCIEKIEREEMVKYGYKGAYAQYLAALMRYPAGLTSVQLCEICGKDKAAVSRMVAEMEQKGLVCRQTSNESLYRAVLRLTDEGMKAAQYVQRRGHEAVKLGGMGLTDEERTILYDVMQRIAENLNAVCCQGLPDEE